MKVVFRDRNELLKKMCVLTRAKSIGNFAGSSLCDLIFHQSKENLYPNPQFPLPIILTLWERK